MSDAWPPFTATPFLQAMLVGLSIAAPVGPIGLLTIRRTLEQGLAAGLVTGLGAACADAAYGALGAWGVQWAIAWLVGLRLPLALGGGALLLWMAWGIARAPLARDAAPLPSSADLLRCFGGSFALTLSNPATILSFVAVFGALAGAGSAPLSPGPMVLGVWLGSALWWLLLCASVSLLRHKLDDAWRRRINLVSAALLAGFALWQWAQLLQR
jgi:threonine/homoserine/homoserine lactone efflux protein